MHLVHMHPQLPLNRQYDSLLIGALQVAFHDVVLAVLVLLAVAAGAVTDPCAGTVRS